MQVLVTSASRLDKDDIAIWLVARAIRVGEAAALDELVRYSTTSTVVVREVLVLDGVHARAGVELASRIRLEPLTSLQPSFFRAQWHDPGRRAALVRSFDHDVVWKGDDDQLPPEMFEIAQDQTLADVARVFTLLKGAAPAVVAHWWEHDPSTPSRTPTSGASSTNGFEASFLPFEIEGTALDLIRSCSQKFQNCSPKLLRVLRVVLDRLNAAKRRSGAVNRAIELGVAAEALFLRYSGEDRAELSFRLANRAAWFLGSSRAHREEIFDCFRAVYEARSTAVHNGEVPAKVRKRDVVEVLAQGCELLELAVMATLNEPDKDLTRLHLG
jgi:hypothetical protein